MFRSQSVRQADNHETTAVSELTTDVVAKFDATGGESAAMNEQVARGPWCGIGAPVNTRVDRSAAALNVGVFGVDLRGDLAGHEARVLVGHPFRVGLFQERLHGGPDMELA
jgi:hypothetical protein